jgi:hypothetical protein
VYFDYTHATIAYSFFNFDSEFPMLHARVAAEVQGKNINFQSPTPDSKAKLLSDDLVASLKGFEDKNFIWVAGTWKLRSIHPTPGTTRYNRGECRFQGRKAVERGAASGRTVRRQLHSGFFAALAQLGQWWRVCALSLGTKSDFGSIPCGLQSAGAAIHHRGRLDQGLN